MFQRAPLYSDVLTPDLSEEQTEILRKMVVTPEPAFMASEFTDDIGFTEEGVRYQLERLTEQGLVERKKPGPQTVVYWITKEGREAYKAQSGVG